MARRTHHKHSSSKGYRRLLDGLADLDGVHRVATGRVKPRMGSGRPEPIRGFTFPVATRCTPSSSASESSSFR